jgi:WD40 repeat protein
MAFQHAYEPPRELSRFDPGVPPPLEAIVRRLLSKDPNDRHASARAVLEDLQALRDGRLPPGMAADELSTVVAIDQPRAIFPQGRWQQLRQALAGQFYRYAPGALRSLQSTSQQVDAALADYARRRQQLVETLRQARSAADEADQPEVVADIESQLAQIDATLARLRSQRDLLHARIKTAEARARFIGGQHRTRRERLHRLALVSAWGVLLIMVAVAVRLSVPMFGWKPAVEITSEFLKAAQSPPPAPPAASEPPDLSLLHTQAAPITIAFHPEPVAGTQRFAVGNADGTVVEYSVRSNTTLRADGRRFIGHLQRVNMIVYSPDGLRLASASDDRTVRIWDVGERRELRRLEGHQGPVAALQFSPDGARIMSGGVDGTVRIWDVQTEAELQTFDVGPFRSSVSALAWSPDGGSFLIGAKVVGAPSLAYWSVTLGREERVFDTTGPIHFLRFTADRRRAFYLAGGKLWVWEIGSQAPVSLLETRWRTVAVSEDGRWALTPGEEGIELWDLDRRECVQRFASDPQHFPSVLAFSADRRCGIAADREGLIRALNLPPPPSPPAQLQVVEVRSPVECVSISKEGFHGVLGCGDQFIAWELRQSVGHLPQRTQSRVSAITFSPDGERMLFGTGQPNSRANYVGLRDYARTPRDWAIGGQRDLRQFKGHTDRITGVAFVASGRRALSGGADGTLRLWDVQSEQPLDTIDVGLPINSLALSPDGRHVLLGLDDNHVRMWDWQERQEVRQFRGHTFFVLAVAFSTDGARAVSGSGDRSIRVWDVPSGECLATLAGHSDRVGAVATSADGRFVLSGSDDSTVRLWDVAAGQSIQVYTGHRGAVHGVAITPDGKRGLSGGEDGTARLWDLTLDQ